MSVAAGGYHPDFVRILAFSDAESDLWGAALIPPSSNVTLATGGRDQATILSGVIEGDGPNESWRLDMGDDGLILESVAHAAQDPDGPPADFDQLCQVTGTIAVEGQHRAISCLGWRSSRSPAVLSGDVDSLRQVAAWLGPEDGFSLLALRSARSKGHDNDTISAAMFASAEGKPVLDPRLSTTYSEAGRAVRAGIEVWLQAGEDPDQQYPRRAVGEAVHAAAKWTVDGLTLEAQPFRWYLSGQEGPGIYFLGHRG